MTKFPPHDPRAERGLCACAIIKPDVINDAARIVSLKDFHFGDYRAVWAVVVNAFERGESIDAILLQAKLKANDAPVDQTKLAEIIASEITPFMAGRYAEIIAEKAARRRLADGAMEAARLAYAVETPLSEVLTAAERLFSKDLTSNGGTVDNATGLITAIEEIDSATGSAIPSGFNGFDLSYGGLFPGELLILAGRTGSGKSAFALQVAEHVAAKMSVLFCSLEMGATEIHRRRIARVAGVGLRALRNGDLTEADRRRIIVGTQALERADLYILDAANCRLPEIARESRRLKQRENLGLIVAKHRNGRPQSFPLIWNGPRMTFSVP